MRPISVDPDPNDRLVAIYLKEHISMDRDNIHVETIFGEFVRKFENGNHLNDLLDRSVRDRLNADYYFPVQDIIAELKTLKVDTLDPATFGKRVMAAYKWLGYQLDDYLSWLSGNSYFPDDVSERIFNTISRPIAECVKKANKQIVSSREALNKPDSAGIILIANSGNYGFEPAQIGNILIDAFEKCNDTENSAIVYFTPNINHRLESEIPDEIWVPIANKGGDKLQDFIDKMGTAWFDFREENGKNYVSNIKDQNLENLLSLKLMRKVIE